SASSGTVGVIGENISLIGTDNATGANTITGLNFGDITTHTNNTFNAIQLGTNYDYYLTSPTIKISGGGAITGATGVSTTTLNSTQATTLSSVGGNTAIGNSGSTLQFIGSNFNLSTAGVVTLAGGQSPADITTGTNQNLTITPNGSGNLILTSDF